MKLVEIFFYFDYINLLIYMYMYKFWILIFRKRMVKYVIIDLESKF